MLLLMRMISAGRRINIYISRSTGRRWPPTSTLSLSLSLTPSLSQTLRLRLTLSLSLHLCVQARSRRERNLQAQLSTTPDGCIALAAAGIGCRRWLRPILAAADSRLVCALAISVSGAASTGTGARCGHALATAATDAADRHCHDRASGAWHGDT